MKLWIDDVRPAPDGWTHEFTVGAAIDLIQAMFFKKPHEEILISLDHDSGMFYNMGGDYIKILDHLEEMGVSNEFFKAWIKTKITFCFHSMNQVGVENMRRIIRKNGWKEI